MNAFVVILIFTAIGRCVSAVDQCYLCTDEVICATNKNQTCTGSDRCMMMSYFNETLKQTVQSAGCSNQSLCDEANGKNLTCLNKPSCKIEICCEVNNCNYKSSATNATSTNSTYSANSTASTYSITSTNEPGNTPSIATMNFSSRIYFDTRMLSFVIILMALLVSR